METVDRYVHDRTRLPKSLGKLVRERGLACAVNTVNCDQDRPLGRDLCNLLASSLITDTR